MQIYFTTDRCHIIIIITEAHQIIGDQNWARVNGNRLFYGSLVPTLICIKISRFSHSHTIWRYSYNEAIEKKAPLRKYPKQKRHDCIFVVMNEMFVHRFLKSRNYSHEFGTQANWMASENLFAAYRMTRFDLIKKKKPKLLQSSCRLSALCLTHSLPCFFFQHTSVNCHLLNRNKMHKTNKWAWACVLSGCGTPLSFLPGFFFGRSINTH